MQSQASVYVRGANSCDPRKEKGRRSGREKQTEIPSTQGERRRAGQTTLDHNKERVDVGSDDVNPMTCIDNFQWQWITPRSK